MEKVTFVEIETQEGIQNHAIIDHGDGEFTSMPKENYDEQQALKKDEPSAVTE